MSLMNIEDRLKQAKKAGQTALNENQSKQLLKTYGIPVINETIVFSETEAVEAAGEMGFPVVLKGLGSTFLHKTERGLVHLHLSDPQSVRRAFFSITKSGGNELEGILVQPQLSGKREFIAGLFRDEQFGPVIMFGMGGIFTEALSDVSFRLAPLTPSDAAEMLQEIRAKRLLGAIRGEKPVDCNRLIHALLGLSYIGISHPDISGIDINPFRIESDGNGYAADALVLLNEKPVEKQFPPPVDPARLISFFHPKSIAFVGASAKINKWGHMLFTITASGGFKGEIYLVNPKGGRIADRPVYKNITEIPGSIDLAVVTIPAHGVENLIPEFKNKGVQRMLLVASGFGETGKIGKKLEKKLSRQAAKSGILILGPNTMGVCNPHINFFCTVSHIRPRPGFTAVVSQSGNIGTQILAFAERHRVGIRLFCGSGNESMITIEDCLDTLEVDPLTRTIMVYIESIKNGRRFFETARRVGKTKPIVLLKGGQSNAGNRAASSHTGAMATDSRIFDAVCRQAGVVKVEHTIDLLDLSAAFSSLPIPKGNRAAIMTLGGGWGVVAADLCSDWGLELPPLSLEIVERLNHLLPPYWSRSNPVDIVFERDESLPMAVMEELLKWNGCDALIKLGISGRSRLLSRAVNSVSKADPTYSPGFLKLIKKSLLEFEDRYMEHIVKMMEKYDKPVFDVCLCMSKKEQTVYRVKGSLFQAISYPTPERAVKAFARMHNYQRFLTRR